MTGQPAPTPGEHTDRVPAQHRSGAASLVDVVLPGGLRRAALLASLVAAVAGLLWMSPVSPAALGRADSLLGDGSPERAARLYDDIARVTPWVGHRKLALYRSAMIWAVDLGDVDEARTRLHRLIRIEPRSPLAAEAWERIGHLHLVRERRPVQAANAFERAFQVNTHAERAPQRLVLAARARMEAGQRSRARELWLDIERRFPDHRVTAILGRGGIALGDRDASGALLLFEEAARIASDPDQRALAQLGVATCLERLGDLDQAIAAIDAADLPDSVMERRIQGIRARGLAESGGL